MKKRYFIIGFGSALLFAIIIGLSGIGFWLWKKPVSLSGGGKGLNSPVGHYQANAMNLLQRHVSGSSREYYSFTVTDNHTGLEVCRYEIPMSQKPVWFREGTGEIHWESDSSRVRFGTSDQIVWSYEISAANP
jgi:hypothetical protein